jgi:MFS family permease
VHPIDVVVLLALIVLWIVLAVLAGQIADRKGRSRRVYVIAVVLVGPVIGPVVVLIALVMPRRRSLA